MLLRRGAGGWEIPHHESDRPRWWHVVRDHNAAFAQLLGQDLTTLRCVGTSPDRRLRFYELELHGPGETPAGEWIDAARLESIELAEPEHRPMLLRCLAERDVDGGELSVRWARPGWFAEAVSWIRGHVGDEAEIVQERTWSISTVLRASTRDGEFFFKAVPRFFAGEPAVTRELGRRHPGVVPDIAAVDEERGWMLMRAFEGDELYGKADARLLGAAASAYAELQLAWVERGDDLLALGCPDRRLDLLEPHADPLLGDRGLLLPGHPEGLSPAELDAVPDLVKRLHAACAELRAYDLPATLEHGDLHTDNVRRRGDGTFLFFDWSDGCLTVPFFGLVPFLEFHDEPLEPGLRNQIRDAYLAPWAARLGRDDLVDAFELAQFVGLFHQAVSYQRIAEGTEPRARWEWERGFPFFVKRLLRSLQ